MSTIWVSVLEIIGVLVLTALASVFVTAEYALTTLERMQVATHLERVGDRRARQVQRAHHTLSFQLSGAQLGITITTLATGYLAEPAIAGLLRPALSATGLPDDAVQAIGYVIALLLATTLSVVFGELLPKNLAIARPLQAARTVAGFQTVFSAVFRWLIYGLNGSANWMVRRLGIEPAEELRSARSPQEIGSLVRASAAKGTLDPGTATLLTRSLRFGDRTAEELMTPRVRVDSLRMDATVSDLVEMARRSGFSRFPVHDGDLDDAHGAVHVKQAFSVPAAQRATTPLSALARPVPRVPDTLEGDALLDRLRDSGLQLALVVDEWGGTAGLVTLEDLVEEIVGDVRDEHDSRESAPVRALGRGSWLMSGLLRADEVSDATGFRMPEGEYETLAGMLVSRLGKIPSVGEAIELDGWQIAVTKMDRHRVAELRLGAPGDGSTAGGGW
ncbi:MAG: hemolysin family protein [Sciscionella sp.]